MLDVTVKVKDATGDVFWEPADVLVGPSSTHTTWRTETNVLPLVLNVITPTSCPEAPAFGLARRSSCGTLPNIFAFVYETNRKLTAEQREPRQYLYYSISTASKLIKVSKFST